MECAHAGDDFLGESPFWSVREQSLYWINCERSPRISRLKSSGEVTHWPMPERVGAIVPCSDGRLLVALARGIFDFEPESGTLQLRARSDHPSKLVLHEGKCDRQGRFWIGTINTAYPEETGGGCFSRLDGGTLVPLLFDCTVSNGLAWSPDGQTMYRACSISRRIMAHPYDCATGTPGEERLFAKIADADGMPDGATVDEEGCYWLALFMGGRLRRYRPDGRIDREMALPVSRPTMPAFGGPSFSTLYLTTTRHGADKAQQAREPLLGSLLRCQTGIAGLPESEFRPSAQRR
jgi:sugar lactone lactonase YvrE